MHIYLINTKSANYNSPKRVWCHYEVMIVHSYDEYQKPFWGLISTVVDSYTIRQMQGEPLFLWFIYDLCTSKHNKFGWRVWSNRPPKCIKKQSIWLGSPNITPGVFNSCLRVKTNRTRKSGLVYRHLHNV